MAVCAGRDVLPQDRGLPRVCRSILMAVQLCPYEGLAVRDPSPNASASPSPTTMRCSGCADPPLRSRWPWASGAPSTNGPPGCFRGAHRRALVVAFRGRGGPASIPKQSTKPARRPPEPPRPMTTARSVGARLARPKRARDFRCWRGDAGLCPASPRPRARSKAYKSLTGQDWKACEALIGAMSRRSGAAQIDAFGK